MPVVAAVARVFQLRKRRAQNIAGGKTWVIASSFEALVWDPTAVHQAMARTKRHPLAALLVKRMGS